MRVGKTGGKRTKEKQRGQEGSRKGRREGCMEEWSCIKVSWMLRLH